MAAGRRMQSDRSADVQVKQNGGLIVPEDEANESGLGAVAGLVALIAAAVGAVRYWAELGPTGPTWGWIALGFGAFACGMELLRLLIGRLRDFGDIMSALGALVMGGAAIAGMFVPIAPMIGIGVWLAGWIVDIAFFDS